MNSVENRISVIFDNGSGVFKAGFSCDNFPRVVFPTMVGLPKHKMVLEGMKDRGMYVGDEAKINRGILKLKYPIRNGYINDIDAVETIWRHAYFNELRTRSDFHPLLITEPPMNPTANREKILEVMFESFNVPKLFIAIQAVLALYSNGKTTGCVLDSGDCQTNIVPIYQGYCLNHAIQRTQLSGSMLTEYLCKLLKLHGHSFCTSAELDIVRDIKENKAFVALNYKEEFKHTKNASPEERAYRLPDGKTIYIGDERFICSELLFDPRCYGMDFGGLHHMLDNTIKKCEIDLRNELYKNIILCGGNTLITGFAERMKKELTQLAQPSINIEIQAKENRLYSAWIGGAILASMPSFQKCWLDYETYNEKGINVAKKFFM